LFYLSLKYFRPIGRKANAKFIGAPNFFLGGEDIKNLYLENFLILPFYRSQRTDRLSDIIRTVV